MPYTAQDLINAAKAVEQEAVEIQKKSDHQFPEQWELALAFTKHFADELHKLNDNGFVVEAATVDDLVKLFIHLNGGVS